MAEFTSLADWTCAQDTAAANEIVLAYSERRQCVGDGAVDLLVAGDNAQDTELWKGMQEWIESSCVKWVDHDNFSTETNYGSAVGMAYTWTTFKTAAGIPSGFRRAKTWPTDWTDYEDVAYSYGPIQAGDIVGPWIYEDLQKAFSALAWTFVALRFAPNVGFTAIVPEYLGGTTGIGAALGSDLYWSGESVVNNSTWPRDWEGIYDDAVLDWSDNSGSIFFFPPLYQSEYRARNTGSVSGTVNISYRSQGVDLSNIPDHLSHEFAAYHYMTTPTADTEQVFYDSEVLGLSSGRLFERVNLDDDTTSTRSVDEYSSASIPDYYNFSWGASPSDAERVAGAVAYYICPFFKWQFTNA